VAVVSGVLRPAAGAGDHGGVVDERSCRWWWRGVGILRGSLVELERLEEIVESVPAIQATPWPLPVPH
jgi:hypothetical protein